MSTEAVGAEVEPASLTAVSDREEHVVRNQKKNVICNTSNKGQ